MGFIIVIWVSGYCFSGFFWVGVIAAKLKWGQNQWHLWSNGLLSIASHSKSLSPLNYFVLLYDVNFAQTLDKGQA